MDSFGISGDAARRAHVGATWLDHEFPGWWRRVDASMLTVTSLDFGPLEQALGAPTFSAALSYLSGLGYRCPPDWLIVHGFMGVAHGTPDLDLAWRAEVMRRCLLRNGSAFH